VVDFNEMHKSILMCFIPVMMGVVPLLLNWIMHYTYMRGDLTLDDNDSQEMRKALENISPQLAVERYVRSCIAEDVRVEDLKLLQFQQLRALGVSVGHTAIWLKQCDNQVEGFQGNNSSVYVSGWHDI